LLPIETGLADVVTPERRGQSRMSAQDEESFFVDTLEEYQWARDAAGLAPSTLHHLVKPVIEVCEHYGTVPWRLTPREVDKYFAGAGKRAQSTLRNKITKIDGYFAFLEQRCAGEILRRFGAVVESPIDRFNRPRHRGDFGLRVPPSQTAIREFFARWRRELPAARKYTVACRDYVMTKIAYLSEVRAAELCAVASAMCTGSTGSGAALSLTARGAGLGSATA
jgi:integrase